MAQKNRIVDSYKGEPRSVILTATGRQKIAEKVGVSSDDLASNGTITALVKVVGPHDVHRDTIEKILIGLTPVDCSSIHRLFDALKLKFDESVYEPVPPELSLPVEPLFIRILKANKDDIDWIGDLEYQFFKDDGVPRELLHEWYSANPNGFWVIWDSEDRVGHIDILPIKPEALENFKNGDITERHINASDLYSIAEKAEVSSLYVESLIIDLPNPQARAIALEHIRMNFNAMVGELCEPANLKQISAMAATRAGDKLIRDLGFKVARPASKRKDHHPFFSISCVQLDSADLSSALLRKKKPKKKKRKK